MVIPSPQAGRGVRLSPVMDHEQLRAALDASTKALIDGTAKHPTLAHLDRVYLPSREAVKQIVKRDLTAEFCRQPGKPI